MAAFSKKPVLLCVTFTAILSLRLVLSLAEFQRFEQPAKADGSLSFLVVGDWGRRGRYNQSQVAHQSNVKTKEINIGDKNLVWAAKELSDQWNLMRIGEDPVVDV